MFFGHAGNRPEVISPFCKEETENTSDKNVAGVIDDTDGTDDKDDTDDTKFTGICWNMLIQIL